MNSSETLDCNACHLAYHWSTNPPVLLSRCGHSICQSCAHRMIVEKSSKCPYIGCPFRYDFCDSLTKNTALIVPKSMSLSEIMSQRPDLLNIKRCPMHDERCDIFCLDKRCKIKAPVCFKCLRDSHQFCDSNFFISKHRFYCSNIKNFELTPSIWIQELKNLAQTHVENYLSVFYRQIEEEIKSLSKRHINKDDMTFDKLQVNFNSISAEVDPETKNFTFKSISNEMLQSFYEQTKQSLLELFNAPNIPLIFSSDLCTSISDQREKCSVRSAPFEICKSFEYSHPQNFTSKRFRAEMLSPSSTQLSVESDHRQKIYNIFSAPEIVRGFLSGNLNTYQLMEYLPVDAQFILINYCSKIPKNLIKIKQLYPQLLCVNVIKSKHFKLFNGKMIRSFPLFVVIGHNGKELKMRHVLSSYRGLSKILKTLYNHAFEQVK